MSITLHKVKPLYRYFKLSYIKLFTECAKSNTKLLFLIAINMKVESTILERFFREFLSNFNNNPT